MNMSTFQAARRDSRSCLFPVLCCFCLITKKCIISCLALTAPVAVPHSKGESRTLPAVLLRFLLFGLKQPVQYFLKATIIEKKERKQLCAGSCAQPKNGILNTVYSCELWPKLFYTLQAALLLTVNARNPQIIHRVSISTPVGDSL